MNTHIELNRPVVAGVDGTNDGIEAAKYAASVAETHRRPLDLVHAFKRSFAIMPMVAVAEPTLVAAGQVAATNLHTTYVAGDNYEVMRDAGERALEKAERRVRAEHRDLQIFKAAIEGSPARVLVRRSRHAFAVVLTRNHLRSQEHFFSGSTSSAVASRALCPTFVVPGNASSRPVCNRILVGFDGSERESAALTFAFDEAAARLSQLVVIHAWQPIESWYRDIPDLADELNELAAHDRAVMSETIDLIACRYPNVDVTFVFEESHPAEALMRHAQEVDLVVVGSRARGGLGGLPLGSTARAVALHSSSPTVVVHPRRDSRAARSVAPAENPT